MIEPSIIQDIDNKIKEIGLESNTVFISISNKVTRALVWEKTITNCNNIGKEIQRYLSSKINNSDDFFIKIDIITESIKISSEDLKTKLKDTTRNNMFEYGIALKEDFSFSLLKEELSGNTLIKPISTHKPGDGNPQLYLDYPAIFNYLKRKYKKVVAIDLTHKKNYIIFKTDSYFLDGKNWLILDNGVRNVKDDLINNMNDAVINGASFLDLQLSNEGKYTYGYLPALGRILTSYNSLRHFSTLYAMSEKNMYDFNTEEMINVKNSLDWGLKNLCVETEKYFFVLDKHKEQDICKLGSNAMLILSITKYLEVCPSKEYDAILAKCYKAIEELFINDQDETIHILSYPSLKTFRKFEIVYYDGELVFSLVRLFKYSKNKDVKALAKKQMNRLINNNYDKYHDHWISYAVNEFLDIEFLAKYVNFSKKNIKSHLKFIENRDTAYPTLLELLTSTYETLEKAKNEDSKSYSLRLQESIYKLIENRSVYQLENGYFYPEVAMYMNKPNMVLHGFYARHDNYRTRIDDAQHHLSGLIHAIKILEK